MFTFLTMHFYTRGPSDPISPREVRLVHRKPATTTTKWPKAEIVELGRSQVM